MTARGQELQVWRDDLSDDPQAILQRLQSTPEEVPESVAAPKG